ncbi:MAG TPA: hypothetical protein PLT66_09270, partial [Bacillota bacterium]|nr:hypothetical protein [Bacillota bacterium]
LMYLSTFFVALSALVSMIIAFVVVRKKQTLLGIALTAPLFGLSLFYLRAVPSILFVSMYLLFVLSAYLLAALRRRSGKAPMRGGLAAVVCAALLLTCVSALFPAETYERHDIAQTLYDFFAEIFPLRTETSVPTISEVTPSKPEESNETSKPEQDNSNKIYNLPTTLSIRDEAPQFSGEKVFSVRCDEPGWYLVRKNSYYWFDGNIWIAVDPQQVQTFACETFYDDLSGKTVVLSPLTFMSVKAQFCNKRSVKFVVDAPYNADDCVMTPYFFTLYASDKLRTYGDSAFYATHTGQFFVTYIYKDIDTKKLLNSSITSTDPLWTEAKERQKTYMTSNRDSYLFVDDYDRALVDEELLSGYSEGMTFQEKVELVTERVKGCAKYNIKAAAPPADN